MGKTHDERGGFVGGFRIDRRAWLKGASAGLFAAGGLTAGGPARAADTPGPGAAELIVRSRHPLDLESTVGALDSWLTANESFFVRSHFGAPAVDLFPWTTAVGGLVDRPLTLGAGDWGGFEPRTVTAVLQCSGNGRAFFRPNIPGVGWERGAVGHAEWAGVRLADVLNRAGLKSGAAHVHFLGSDGPPSPKVPVYLRSLPLEKALHPDTLLATRMNGEPLPTVHGGPVRLVVPGWTGNHWMKWVRWITVAREEAPGFYQQTGYRLPRSPAPPDAVLKSADLAPVTTLNVKSLITWPAEGATLPAGRHEVRGVAWTGEGHVEKVDVSLGTERGGDWSAARLIDEPRPWRWRRWRFTAALDAPGRVVVRSRATDSRGQTQPAATPYNKSGYLWNGIDHVTFAVG